MRSTAKVTIVAITALGIGLAGCSNGSGTPGTASSGKTSAGASGAASSGAPAPGTTETGSAASCLVGTWKATGLSGKLSGPVTGTFTGGGGTLLTVDSAGKTQVDFGPMQPVTFAFSVAGGDVKGSFSYGGKVNGTIKSATTPAGTWEPQGAVDFSTLTVTVDLTSPAAVRVADKTSIAEFAGTGTADTGGAVDAQPVLKKSSYDCSGGTTLKLGPPQGGPDTGTWTFTKA
ncbi:hypothetical protein ACFO1B_05685 [Dactylosporangium siamense]|uniref:Lipoprotein n=1 Tax=Dactylosporangium siamense TaxID=685454 RepID=A0A919PH46_9ACTN|nr:hypothetical protein [Dactylosporangium siamense]GIG43247.1 hypothetical protein Dsi01nite_012880 [Dactylosporangium siamense]